MAGNLTECKKRIKKNTYKIAKEHNSHRVELVVDKLMGRTTSLQRMCVFFFSVCFYLYPFALLASSSLFILSNIPRFFWSTASSFRIRFVLQRIRTWKTRSTHYSFCQLCTIKKWFAYIGMLLHQQSKWNVHPFT